jgi:hypothetical protein
MKDETFRIRFSPTTSGFQFRIEPDTEDEANSHDWVTIAKGSEEKLTLFFNAIDANYARLGTRMDVERLWRVFDMGYQRRYIE